MVTRKVDGVLRSISQTFYISHYLFCIAAKIYKVLSPFHNGLVNYQTYVHLSLPQVCIAGQKSTETSQSTAQYYISYCQCNVK